MTESPAQCSSPGLACYAHDDDLLEYIPRIESIIECRQRCQDNPACKFLTFFDDQSYPFHNDCFLFSSCQETYVCENCVSETRECYEPNDGTCSISYTGLIENNVVGYLTDIETDVACSSQCASSDGCLFYTFYATIGECFLLDRIIEPVKECDSCSTGPKNCDIIDLTCSMFVNGTFTTSIKLTNPEDVTSAILFGYEHCSFRYLMTGGGGMATYNANAGAGSEYLRYDSLPM